MQITFFQLFSVLFRKHFLNHVRNRNIIKELIGVMFVAGICIALKVGGGNGLSYIPVYMPLAIMLFCRGAVLSWVAQKQQKHAEVQKIMGASFSAYLFSWIVFFLLNGIFLSIIFVGILLGAKVFSAMSIELILQMFGLYFLLMMAVFSFCLMLSSFFSDSQLASQVITFIQLFGVALFFLLRIDEFRNSSFAMGFVSIIPTVCFQFTSILVNTSTNQYGDLPFTKLEGYVMLAGEALVYFMFFYYFEKVIPNQNGTNKHPLFFLKSSKRPQKDLQERFELSQLSSARFFEEEKQQKTITCQISNLQKIFGNKKIINGLGLTLYKKQIFCLLGHNGAGKSTTINMLTGILKPDEGNITIFGLDYYTQMSQIRQKVGVCLQTDVLYERLTVRQHLEFFARLKGFTGQTLENKVDHILKMCCLQTQVNKRSQTLSGGNKRKLCLACAAIGDSELIFLDQPSSGMDPNTRRLIWGMIEQLREEGKTIVLTTHHLEEAEALSNRIGILASGQLMILGSCHYIKEKFGVGYNLKINLENFPQSQRIVKKQQIREIVTKILGSYREDDQMAVNEMKMILQTSSQENYPELFEYLEGKGIEFSLTMSSLEDIFVRIGLDPDSILKNEPLPEIEKIELPQYEPHYSFAYQLNAVFVKKALTVLRSFSVFISLIMPTMYIAIGAVVSMVIGQNPTSPERAYIILWSKYYTLVYLMSIAYSFNTSSFCGSIVAEKQMKFKYLSFVMGMRKIPYWLGTICFDMILFWIPSVILCLIIVCFPYEKSYIFVDKFGYFFILFGAFSLSFLPFTYLWTHAFEKSQTAYKFFPFFVMIIFAILPQIPIYIIPQNQALKWILPIFSPLLALVNGMVSQELIGSEAYNYFRANNTKVYTTPTVWYSVGVLLVQGVIFMTATIVLDNYKFRLNDKEELSQEDKQSQRSQDLIKQQKKIDTMTTPSPVVVDSLFKKFSNGYVGVKNNSFSVESGETFGLLGPNGAGKSTTFNILTAADSKTHGTVKLLGTEVNRSVMKIFNDVGVCPQFNPIYDNLTVTEHLRFFGKLKGLSGSQLEEIIQFFQKSLQLQEYKDQRAGTLSGGNKRKLCVCIALIGNPSLLFMDEPSAGVDAISRRYLWNILASSAQDSQRAIILTTHSIHEAESLCKRIGILIKGEFICIGSPTQLKKRYGKGYRINVRCQNQSQISVVKEQMIKAYKDYEIQQSKQDMKISFLVPKGNFKFSQAFKLFYSKLYQNKMIKQYEIAQNSLEQVFIYLSKLQPQPEQNNFKPKSKYCCWQKSDEGCRLLC